MSKGVVIAAAFGLVAVAGTATAWSGPAAGLVAGATTVAPSAGTAGPSTTQAAGGPGSPAASADDGTLPEPASPTADPVRTLVPRIASIPAVLATSEDRLAAIDRALGQPTTAIAVADGPGTLCAVVPIQAPVMADGRWERNGEPLASTGERRRDPPGYGDCLPNDEGEPFRDGVYQYVAVGATGALSAAATIVIGVDSVVVWLLNDGDEPVCMMHASPTQADFYEAYATSPPLEPGEAMVVRLADVDHDVRLFGCPPDEVLRTTRLSPVAGTYIALFDVADADEPTATSPASGGATPPATTTRTTPEVATSATPTTTA